MYVEETGRHVGRDAFCYLSLVQDAYSGKIVGWSVGVTLGVYYTIEALRMALCGAGADLCGLIHHSDRGSQYASREYVSLLMSRGMMTLAQAEKCDGELRKMWHIYREEAIKKT